MALDQHRKCGEDYAGCRLGGIGACCKWSELASLAQSTDMPKGSVLEVSEGAGTPICFVCDGTVGLQHFLSDGRRTVSEMFVPGDVIDCRRDLRCFQGEVVALNDARVCTIRADRFDGICGKNQAIDEAFSAQIREQAHVLRDHCIDIGKKTPAERVASFLFEQMRRRSLNGQKGSTVRLQLTYADMGDYLAIQPETVCRTLSALGSEGMISVGPEGAFEVVDLRKLKRIANGGSPRRRRSRSRAQ